VSNTIFINKLIDKKSDHYHLFPIGLFVKITLPHYINL